jgi:methionyl-tRNA formyltransferase
VRLLFWGTPEFAVPSLRALLGEGFDVVGVVTRPDRPQGRSRSRLIPSPIKEVATAEGLTVLEPDRPRGAEFLDTVRVLSPDVSVVVAYGHLLVADVIDLPPLGTVNVHASLLPALRGAAPIQAAIREGLSETGVSIMRIVPALDAGPVLLQIPTPIVSDETFGELQLRLSELGAQGLIEALALMALGVSTESPQDESAATYARKVDRASTRIDWSGPAAVVARFIRAYDPRPGATTCAPAGDVKLFGAQTAAHGTGTPEGQREGDSAGTIRAIDDAGCTVACGAGDVRITQVQPAGRSRMAPAEWARGRGIAVGDRLTS